MPAAKQKPRRPGQPGNNTDDVRRQPTPLPIIIVVPIAFRPCPHLPAGACLSRTCSVPAANNQTHITLSLPLSPHLVLPRPTPLCRPASSWQSSSRRVVVVVGYNGCDWWPSPKLTKPDYPLDYQKHSAAPAVVCVLVFFLEPPAMTELSSVIAAALNGDGDSLTRLESSMRDAGVAGAALSLLHDPSALAPHVLQFASVMVMRFARTGQGTSAELSQLCEQCLGLGLSPPPGTRPIVQNNLLAAASAAAARISTEAVVSVHAEACKREEAALSSAPPSLDGALVALKLLRWIAEECGRDAVRASTLTVLQSLAPQTLAAIVGAASAAGAGCSSHPS